MTNFPTSGMYHVRFAHSNDTNTSVQMNSKFVFILLCLQCLDAVGSAAGRASGLYKTEWWGAGMVICLQRGAD